MCLKTGERVKNTCKGGGLDVRINIHNRAVTESMPFPLFVQSLVGTSPPMKGRDSKESYELVPTSRSYGTLRQKEP